jgi:hypothetical protein
MSSGFLTLADVRHVQIDHTSRCNLLCPQCSRVTNGRLNPLLPLGELSLGDYERIFTPDFSRQLESVLFCGNYGDAAASNTFLESVRFLKSRGIPAITVMSNGSLQSPEWWRELASLLSGPRDKVCFSIDGLADTNHLYRVNSRFDKIMANTRAFISAGGKARWDYLVFEHNQHQVAEAERLAGEMGFKSFALKRTARFINQKNFSSGLPSETEEGAKQQIKAPTAAAYRSESFSQFTEVMKEHGSWESYAASTEIDCKFKKSRTIFIDFEARLWPCCWLGAPIHLAEENPQKRQMRTVLEKYGHDFNSLRHHSLADLLSHEWLRVSLPQSWEAGGDRPPACSRTCGKQYDFTSSSDKNRTIRPLAKQAARS